MKQKLAVGVVTAPRHKPTVNRTLSALKFVYDCPKVYVFAEPFSKVPEHENQTIIQHEEQMGCFKNFDFAHEYLIENTDADYVLILADDIKFKSDFLKVAMSALEQIPKKNFGYLALYTPKGMAQFFPKNPHSEIIELDRGWGRGGWGGCYLMNRGIAKLIIEHPFYQTHKYHYKKNQQFDECMKEVCYQMKLKQYYMNPSLIDHVGETSTIGHKFRTLDKGLNYGKAFRL